ncbi:MAG: tetratricopeptide repeat protein, partial [Acidobacteriota bacterium]
DTKLANMTANVGSAHYNLRDYAAAEEKHREALDLHELSGSDLLIVATTLYNLTNSRVQLGQRREAKEDYLRVLELRRTNGAPPRAIADSLHSVGHNSLIVGDPESALPALDEALRLHRSLAEDGPTLSIAKVAKTFARARHAAGQLHEAQALYEEAIRIRSLLRGSGHQSVHELEPHMARLLIDLGELDRAEVLARRYLDWAVANRPPEHFDIVVARSIQGAHRLRESPDPQAEDDVRAGIEALDERFGSEAFVTVWTRRQLERLE